MNTESFDETPLERAVRLQLARVSPAVAAELLGISVRQLRAWVAKGYGPTRIDLSKRIHRYDVKELLAWLEACAQASATPCPQCGHPVPYPSNQEPEHD